jgi:outer membrane protein OmpA-like peptidoglycan-associated protein
MFPLPLLLAFPAGATGQHAEIRRIVPEIRRIQGLDGNREQPTRRISGEVETIVSVQRSLAGSGLQTRLTNGALEVTLPGDVLFDFDKATIRPGATRTLEAVKRAAEQTGARPIRVEGHSDAVGSPAYNMRLSESRAQAVVAWLTRAGISPSRETAKGFGATRPVAPNTLANGADNPAGRQKNRRVTVYL